jgi:hypothetical protein
MNKTQENIMKAFLIEDWKTYIKARTEGNQNFNLIYYYY